MWRKIVASICIVAGLALLLSPWVKDCIIVHLQEDNQAGRISVAKIVENKQRKASYDYQAIEPPTFANVVKAGMGDYTDAIIGNISIKSIGINLPILKGMTTANLLVGAATMKENQKMGEGNYSLAGHHMKKQRLLFGPLLNIAKGSLIELSDYQKTYVYKVSLKEIVSEKDVGVIDHVGKPQLTLVTCDKPTKTSKRLIVKADLQSIKDYRE